MTILRRVAGSLRCERGFTLSELLVVLVFLGVISAAFATVFSSSIRHEKEIREQTLTQGEMRAAVDGVIREIRSAYSGSGWPIETATSTTLTFTMPDRSSTPVLRRVAYRLSSGKLERAAGLASAGSPSNWVTLVSGITTTAPFSYLDELGTPTSTAASVRTVKLSLTFATATGNGRSYTFTSNASPRMTAP